MSLTKIITLPTGHDVNYWRVQRVSIHPIEQTVVVRYQGYKDKAAFDGGASPAVERRFELYKDDFVALPIPGLVADTKAWLVLVDQILKESVAQLSDATEDPNDVI